MTQPSVNPVAAPADIGGYAIVGELAPGKTYLAAAGSGRLVVLKMLDADCMLRRRLHPFIKDRLECVRGLAHSGVANLYGVERDGERVFAVWEYVQGRRLDEAVAGESVLTAKRSSSIAGGTAPGKWPPAPPGPEGVVVARPDNTTTLSGSKRRGGGDGGGSFPGAVPPAIDDQPFGLKTADRQDACPTGVGDQPLGLKRDQPLGVEGLEDLRRLAREVVRAVEALHALGIVHGAISAGNVIVTPAGAVRLTHVSPLLHHEPQIDAAAVVTMLRPLAAAADPALAGALESAVTLRDVAAILAAPAEPPSISSPSGDKPVEPQRRSFRRRALAGAILAAIAGLLVAYGLWRWASRLPQPPREREQSSSIKNVRSAS